MADPGILDGLGATPAIPATAEAGASGGLTAILLQLQSGQSLRATVLAAMDNGLATLATALGSFEVSADIPLSQGAAVELSAQPAAPGQPGLRIVVADPSRAEIAETPHPARVSITQVPVAQAPVAAPARLAAAIADARQAAVIRQDGLAPLMADLDQAMRSDGAPPQVRAAAAAVLDHRLPSDEAPTGARLKQAVAGSGVFFERTMVVGPSADNLTPAADLKGALLALGQALRLWRAAVAPSQLQSGPQPAVEAPPATVAAPPPSVPSDDRAPAGSPAVAPLPADQAAAHPPAALVQALIGQLAGDGATLAPRSPPRLMRGEADVLAAAPDLAPAAAPVSPPVSAPAHARAPPPFRGAPRGQPAAAPGLASGASPYAVADRLVRQTDAAVARQQLLQIASLSDPPGPAGAAPTGPHWLFELPLATPQGTAIAQFEISRDGRSPNAADDSALAWRVGFSVDAEPVGPVHARLTMVGDRMRVSLWAERDAAVAELRRQAPLLSEALGGEQGGAEITIRPGAPTRPPAPSGRFVDLAS